MSSTKRMTPDQWSIYSRDQYTPETARFDDGYGLRPFVYDTRKVSPEESAQTQEAIEYIRRRGGDFKNYDSNLEDSLYAQYGILNASNREAQNTLSELGLGLDKLDERSASRQGQYGRLVDKYLNDYGAGQYSDQFQERKVLDQLYNNATGKGTTPGDLNRQIESQQRAIDFARNSSGAGTSGVNPLLAARGISNSASQAFNNYEQEQGRDAANERLALQRDIFGRMQGSSNRDYAAGESLRESGYDEQRRLEGIQSDAAKSYADDVRRRVADNEQAKIDKRQHEFNVIGRTAGATAGAMALASDERVKKNVKDGKTRIDIIFEKVKPKEFEYKYDPMHSKRLGVMAQDLEDAGLDYMVQESPEGVKHVLTDELSTLLFGAQSRVFDRLERLEDAIMNSKKKRGGK